MLKLPWKGKFKKKIQSFNFTQFALIEPGLLFEYLSNLFPNLSYSA